MNSPTFSIKGENLSTFCYGNSPGPSLKKKESENTRFFLSEQKENHIKLMNSTLNERKKNTNLIYYPNSFNSPNKLLLKDKDESQNSSSQKPQQPTKSNFRNMKNSDIKQNNKNSDIKQNNHKFLNSLKNFSDEFLTSTSNFINSNLNKMSDRKQCSCDIGLSKLESCKTALKWFKSNEVKTATMNDLKLLYENLQKEKGDEKSLDQIRRDITRTYSHNSFFNENSNG